MNLRFYYDVVCPYAYLASLRVEALAKRTGSVLEWCPVLLGGLYRNHQTADVPANDWVAPKVAIGAADLIREAHANGAPFNHNHRHPQRSVSAMRLITAATGTDRVALSKALFKAYWVDGQDINDESLLNELGRAHGTSLNDARSESNKDALRSNTADASNRGVFGVPSFELNERLWWGQDRMHLVEQALGGSPQYMPSPERHNVKKISFFHDFSSPYSYLAATQMRQLAAEWGIEIEWKPMLLGALFREIGTANVPIFTFGEARRAYLMQDLLDWASWWAVPFRFNPHFPMRTVTAGRVAIVDPSTTESIYAAAWANGTNLNDDAELIEALNDAGHNGADLVHATQNPSVKATLRANTEEAAALGACGAPTIVVGDQIFWGQDRLNRVFAAL